MKIQKILKFIGAAAACLTFAAVGTVFASADTGAFTVTGGAEGTDYSFSDSTLTINTSTPLIIRNTDPNTATTDRIIVDYGVDADITLAGVNIDVSSNDMAAFAVYNYSSDNVTITLADETTNILRGHGTHAGLEKNGSNGTLTIKGESNGTGSLEATGGESGAGIGGGNGDSSSNIIIEGGVITATGGDLGAGIGGGFGGGCSDIVIKGGSVKATGGTYNGRSGAAIGYGITSGGDNGDEVTPTDGKGNPVYLFELGTSTSSLKIDGKDYPLDHGDGKVYLYLTEGYHIIERDGITEAGIFELSGSLFSCSNVGLVVTPTDSTNPLVYGTDYTYENHVLTIKSDTPVTIKNVVSDPITDHIEVAKDVSANITLDGVNIDVSKTTGTDENVGYDTYVGFAALRIADNSTGNVTITLADGTTNVLKSGQQCAGLQKNGAYISTTQGKLTITGTGSLNATGGQTGAGIGSGSWAASSNITIESGTIIATGGPNGAGIGGGYSGNGKYITINGGTVTATGVAGAGIGGGVDGSGTYITINGGTVIATGTEQGAGIGGGYGSSSSGEKITITGGTVTATGSANFRGYNGSAGIGGGYSGSSNYITISGGTVTAMGGAEGAGIGGGRGNAASNIIISGGSVKAIAGTDANAIGGGAGKDAVTPTDGKGNDVYLLEIENPMATR